MRIWMLEPGGWGGISQSSQYLAAALRDSGDDVLLITAADAESVGALEEPDIWRLVSWSRERGLLRTSGLYRAANALSYLWALFSMYRRARRDQPDILHLQGYYVPVLFWLTAVVLRDRTRGIVLTCHNAFLRSGDSRGGWFARLWVRRLIRLADVTVLHAADDERRLEESGLGSPARIAHISLGWHPVTPASRDDARAALGVGPHAVIALLLGYLREDKGLDLLALALADFDAEERRQLRVVVAGEDRGALQSFRGLVTMYGLEDVVRIIPGYLTLERMSGLVAAADMMILAHRQASDSGILRMAMAGGVPVVAARTGGFAEVVEAASNGWLFESGSAKDLARVLRTAVRTPGDTRRAMGVAGRAYATQHYGWAAIAAAYQRAYATAATGR